MNDYEIVRITNIKEERSDEGSSLDVWSFSIFLKRKIEKEINSEIDPTLVTPDPEKRIVFAITYEALHYDPANKIYNTDVNIWQEVLIEKIRSGALKIELNTPLYVEATEGFAKRNLEELFKRRYFLSENNGQSLDIPNAE